MTSILRILGVGALLILAADAAPGQPGGFRLHATPAAPEERFVLMQANRANAVTLRLDRYSGEVSRLELPDGRGEGWVTMPVPGVAKLRPPAKQRFQIYASENESPLLFDQATGKAWRMVATREEAQWIWEVIGG